jgi:hypothetical protein
MLKSAKSDVLLAADRWTLSTVDKVQRRQGSHVETSLHLPQSLVGRIEIGRGHAARVLREWIRSCGAPQLEVGGFASQYLPVLNA